MLRLEVSQNFTLRDNTGLVVDPGQGSPVQAVKHRVVEIVGNAGSGVGGPAVAPAVLPSQSITTPSPLPPPGANQADTDAVEAGVDGVTAADLLDIILCQVLEHQVNIEVFLH